METKQSCGKRAYLPLPVELAVLPVLFLVVDFLECFLVDLAVSLLVLVCAPLAGGLAGVWAAKVIGTVATAKAMVAKSVFFMVFFLPRGLCPLTFS